MCLMEQDTKATSLDVKAKRIYGSGKGGFTNAMCQAKSKAIAGYIARMLNKVNWCIATAYKKLRYNSYTNVEIKNYANPFYLVEKRIESKLKVIKCLVVSFPSEFFLMCSYVDARLTK